MLTFEYVESFSKHANECFINCNKLQFEIYFYGCSKLNFSLELNKIKCDHYIKQVFFISSSGEPSVNRIDLLA